MCGGCLCLLLSKIEAVEFSASDRIRTALALLGIAAGVGGIVNACLGVGLGAIALAVMFVGRGRAGPRIRTRSAARPTSSS